MEDEFIFTLWLFLSLLFFFTFQLSQWDDEMLCLCVVVYGGHMCKFPRVCLLHESLIVGGLCGAWNETQHKWVRDRGIKPRGEEDKGRLFSLCVSNKANYIIQHVHWDFWEAAEVHDIDPWGSSDERGWAGSDVSSYQCSQLLVFSTQSPLWTHQPQIFTHQHVAVQHPLQLRRLLQHGCLFCYQYWY